MGADWTLVKAMDFLNKAKEAINQAKKELIDAGEIDADELQESFDSIKSNMAAVGRQVARGGRVIAKHAANSVMSRSAGVQEASSNNPSGSKTVRDASVDADVAECVDAGWAEIEDTTVQEVDKGQVTLGNDWTAMGASSRKASGKAAKGFNRPYQKYLMTIALCCILCISVICFASCQGATNDSADESLSSEKGVVEIETFEVSLEVSCSENLLLSRYDVEILVDDAVVGYLDHGASDTFSFTVEEGRHDLRFCKEGDDSVDGHRSFEIVADSMGTCSIECKSDMVKINSFEMLTTEEKQRKEAEAGALKEEELAEDSSATGEDVLPEPTGESSDSDVGEMNDVQEPEDGQEPENSVLNAADCPDINTLLTQSGEDASWFSSLYFGETIEFDGYIADIVNHENYDTRYDVLILGGDYGVSPSLGPYFRFTDVNTFDMGIEDLFLPSYMSNNTNVHVVAVVGSYSSDYGWLELDPVSITAR